MMAMDDGARILLFAKAPVPGEVKSRLIPSVGADEACEIYQRMLTHAIETALSVCAVEIWITPSIDHAFFDTYRSNSAVSLFQQHGDDLGRRMFNAARATDVREKLLLGADCPGVDGAYLRRALGRLRQHDAVVGPAEDGGYVLLGLKQVEESLFRNIEWGGSSVCAETCRRLNSLGWCWSLLPLQFDIDVPADLARLDQISLRGRRSVPD